MLSVRSTVTGLDVGLPLRLDGGVHYRATAYFWILLGMIALWLPGIATGSVTLLLGGLVCGPVQGFLMAWVAEPVLRWLGVRFFNSALQTSCKLVSGEPILILLILHVPSSSFF